MLNPFNPFKKKPLKAPQVKGKTGGGIPKSQQKQPKQKSQVRFKAGAELAGNV